LVSIGLALSEEKIFEKVYNVRWTPSDGNSSPDPLCVNQTPQVMDNKGKKEGFRSIE
jgi:hypothetical protein